MNATATVTLADLLAEGRCALAHQDNARRDTEVLLAHACGLDRTALYRQAQLPIADGALFQFRQLIAKRGAGVPVAYLLGSREFWSMDLEVTPGVLVPRPETELLVETVLKLAPAAPVVSVLDLGTGSGAIALALARERPAWLITAIDQSPDALAVAGRNKARHALSNVSLLQSRWTSTLAGCRFDVIVSNPPYVRSDDPALADGEISFEPRAALDGGHDGLQALREIVSSAPAHLAAGGWLVLEHGAAQGPAVRRLLAERGLVDIDTAHDLQGLERVSRARLRADQQQNG